MCWVSLKAQLNLCNTSGSKKNGGEAFSHTCPVACGTKTRMLARLTLLPVQATTLPLCILCIIQSASSQNGTKLFSASFIIQFFSPKQIPFHSSGESS
jgi:hypothetical protein